MKKIFSLLLTITICHLLYGQGNVGIGTLTPAYKLQVQTGNGYGISHTNGTVDVATFVHNDAGGFIGTKSNHPFQLYANDGINQFILTPTGNVGIGIFPQHRLDVHYGSPRTGVHPFNKPLYVTGDFGEANGVEFRVSDGSNGIGFGSNTIYAAGSAPDQTLRIASKGYAPLVFKTYDFERMIISPDGNVGIGTYPTAQLQLSNSVQNRKIILYDDAENNNEFFGFGISWGMLRYHVNSSVSDHVFFAGSSDSTANELMRIKGTGQVGIGVTMPQNKLDIATGPTRTGTHPSNMAAYITANLTAPGIGFEIRHYDGTVGIGLGAQTMYAAGSNDNQNLTFLAKGSTGSLILKTNLLERLVVTGSGNVGIGTSTPNASAALDITSNSKGILIPRMTTTERNGIPSPATGLLVFDITTNSFWYRQTSSWAELSDNLDTEVYRNGTDKIYMGLTDSVGIGTLDPAYKLEVRTANSQYGLAQTDGTIQLATWLGSGGEIGTITNHAFRLFANDGFKQFELLPNGKIGIGLSDPLNRFDINNGAADRTGTHATNQALYVTGDFGSASNGVEFRNNDASQGIGFGSNTIYAAGSNTTQDLNLAAKGATGNITFNSNNTEKVRITGIGHVGIGTTLPNAPLQFASTAANRKIVLYEASNNDHQFIGLGNTTTALRYQVNAIASDHIFYAGTNPGNSSELMRIKGTGNVGIGINAPNEKLEIAGDGRAFFGDGAGPNRKGLLIDGVEPNGARIEAFDYLTNAGLDLLLNPLGGNVGIGTSNSNAPLQFSNTSENRKVVLSETANNNHQFIGLGQNTTSLRYQVASTTNDHVFYAGVDANNSNELVRIKGNGKVGIGMGLTNPLNRFDINNGAANRTGTHGTGLTMYVTGDFGSASNGVEFRSNDASQGIGFGYNTIYAAGSSPDQPLFLAAKGASGSLSFITNGTERLKINGTGNFGFGVTSPANKLDVHNGTARTNLSSHNTGQALYVTGGGEFRSADATKGLGIGSNIIFATGSDPDVDLSMAAKGASGNLIYATNGIERMRITSSGNVGLGISNPNAPLQFSNNLIAKKVVLYELANNANEYSGWGVGASGSMLYQVPSENANFVFNTGAGANGSLELFKFGSLSGFQFNRNVTMGGTLTTTGNATIGGNATISGTVTVNGTITTEAFIQPTLLSGFANYNAGYATAAYYKDKMGVVHFRGLVLLNANQNGLVIFTLPAGYRPSTSGTLLFTTLANTGVARIDVLANGNVVVMGPSNGWLSLDGITFRAD